MSFAHGIVGQHARGGGTGQSPNTAYPDAIEAFQHTDRLLIVDQPMDHIDNAFVADTLMVAVKNCRLNNRPGSPGARGEHPRTLSSYFCRIFRQDQTPANSAGRADGARTPSLLIRG